MMHYALILGGRIGGPICATAHTYEGIIQRLDDYANGQLDWQIYERDNHLNFVMPTPEDVSNIIVAIISDAGRARIPNPRHLSPDGSAVGHGHPVCCICGAECDDEWGNSPAPISDEGRCCWDCNVAYVIPARMKALADANARANGAI